MDSTRFDYVTYIRGDQNKVWEALTTDEISRKFWFDSRQESQWEKGSPWRMSAPDGRLVNSGEVLDIVPPQHLALSWRNELKEDLREEGYSRLTFDLDQQGQSTKLSLTHEIAVKNSALIEDVSRGWPLIIASLKSLIETGDSLAETREWPSGL